jgi:hypothetical protein
MSIGAIGGSTPAAFNMLGDFTGASSSQDTAAPDAAFQPGGAMQTAPSSDPLSALANLLGGSLFGGLLGSSSGPAGGLGGLMSGMGGGSMGSMGMVNVAAPISAGENIFGGLFDFSDNSVEYNIGPQTTVEQGASATINSSPDLRAADLSGGGVNHANEVSGEAATGGSVS